MVVSQDRHNFIHAHPLDEPAVNDPGSILMPLGPSPSSVTTVTGFRSAGLYRLWVQFQRQGKVITVPYTFQVDAGETAQQPKQRSILARFASVSAIAVSNRPVSQPLQARA